MSEGKKEQMEEDSFDEPVKENSEKIFIIGLVSVILIIAVIVGVFFYAKNNYTPAYETYTSENQFVFTKMAGLWNTQWQRGDNLYNIHFHFNPAEAESVPIIDTGFNLTKFNEGPVYLTFDPKEYGMAYITVAAGELSFNLVRALNVNVLAACTENLTGCYDRQIKTCASNDSVIYLREANETKILLGGAEGKCMIIQGSQMELVRAVDKLLFMWFKIK